MTDLSQFTNDEDPIISEVALKLESILASADHQLLEKEQINELINDLFEVQEVRQMSEALDRKIKILAAFNTMKTIIGLIPK